MGRHWVVPWMRMPAVSVHQVSARTRHVGQVDEGLAGEEVVLDVVHDASPPSACRSGSAPGRRR